ncbi:universal stress protein [Dactylosporangium sp. NPDC000555]|uniref:universal stress protein n=1 Tax=Dactylosporangium sp. NPDC000555 TaxID=3154260 RepID=UPI003320A0AF
MGTDSRVVVGVDGSPESLEALTWAACDASRRHRPLHVVHAFQLPTVYGPFPPPVPSPYDDETRAAAERMLAGSVARARTLAPGLEVTSDMPMRQPASALLAAAEHADTVVVGSRGLGGFAGLLLGSVSIAVSAHATCPVVVTHHGGGRPATGAGRILVGVDAAHDAERALRFAFEQASARRTGLTAVSAHVWSRFAARSRIHAPGHDPGDLYEDERRALAESTSGWSDRYPDVDIQRAVLTGAPAAVLTELSAGAQLLVVGSRGHGGFTGLLLGSVSRAVVRHAECPVAVVH